MISASHPSTRVALRHMIVNAGRYSAFASVAVFVLALIVAPAAAHVHIRLASSIPAKDAHLTTAPREIRLTFTGSVDVTKAQVELIGPNETKVALDPLRAVPDSSRIAVSKITEPLAGGTYTVRWQAIASDGAPGSGSFGFMYMPGAGH